LNPFGAQIASPTCDPTTVKDLRRTSAKVPLQSFSGQLCDLCVQLFFPPIALLWERLLQLHTQQQRSVEIVRFGAGVQTGHSHVATGYRLLASHAIPFHVSEMVAAATRGEKP